MAKKSHRNNDEPWKSEKQLAASGIKKAVWKSPNGPIRMYANQYGVMFRTKREAWANRAMRPSA